MVNELWSDPLRSNRVRAQAHSQGEFGRRLANGSKRLDEEPGLLIDTYACHAATVQDLPLPGAGG